jgi:hypothetical protein
MPACTDIPGLMRRGCPKRTRARGKAGNIGLWNAFDHAEYVEIPLFKGDPHRVEEKHV